MNQQIYIHKGKLSYFMAHSSFPGPAQLFVTENDKKVGGAWEWGYMAHTCAKLIAKAVVEEMELWYRGSLVHCSNEYPAPMG